MKTTSGFWKLPAGIAAGFIIGAGLYMMSDPHGKAVYRPDVRPGAADAASPGALAKKEAGLEDWNTRIGKATAAEFASLMREVMKISDPALRAKVAAVLVQRWVSVDMKGFIAFVDESEVDDDDADADTLWAVLAPALANALPNLPEEIATRPELSEVVRRLIEYSARENPDRALAWTKQWLLGDAYESAMATIAGEMIKKSPEKALGVLADIDSAVRRVDAISAIASVYGETHPKEATAWARSLENPAEQPYAMNAVLAARASVDPAAASVDFSDFRQAMETAYSAEREADMKRHGMTDIKEDRNGEPLTPEEAMDSENLPSKVDPQMRLLEESAAAIAQNWAATDPGKAMPWAQSLPEGPLRDQAIEGALSGWATEQPQAAYAFYKQNYAANPDPAQDIFESWAGAEPEAAAAEATQLKDPAMREKAVAGVVSGWLDSASDETALDTWVDQLPTSRDRDVANSQIADSDSYDSPKTSWNRAMKIEDQLSRREALKSAFASMVESDPAEARTMLAAAKSLSSDEATRLDKMLRAATSKTSN